MFYHDGHWHYYPHHWHHHHCDSEIRGNYDKRVALQHKLREYVTNHIPFVDIDEDYSNQYLTEHIHIGYSEKRFKDSVDNAIADFKAEVRQKFEVIEDRLDTVEKQMKQLQADMKTLEAKVDAKIAEINEKLKEFDALREEFNTVKEKTDAVTLKVSDVETKTNDNESAINVLNTRVNTVTEKLTALETQANQDYSKWIEELKGITIL